MDDPKNAPRTVLVTGGAGRLGHAIAQRFAKDGAHVAVCDRPGDSLERAQQTARSDAGHRLALAADVTKYGDMIEVIDKVEAWAGLPDVLVTCAAVYPNRAVIDMEVDEWDRVFDVNVRGVMIACQILARRWIDAKIQGTIVNLSSGAARSARRGAAAYCGSKAAVNMLTEVLATELGPYGIRVNAVSPGLVMDDVVTEKTEGLHPYYREMLKATPLGRTGAPGDIAEAVAFLASERSAWTTGANLEVTGGSHCGRTHVPWTTDIS